MTFAVATGQIVRVRSRQYLVEDVVSKPSSTEDTLVSLSCLEDDALGESLSVLWEREIDAKVVAATSWESIAHRGFDNPRLFSAYLHTLRWNCVTSTDTKLFQAPYRAGIEVKAYQLERELDIQVRRAALDIEPSWVPAIENKGEGVFIAFRKQAIEDWLQRYVGIAPSVITAYPRGEQAGERFTRFAIVGGSHLAPFSTRPEKPGNEHDKSRIPG